MLKIVYKICCGIDVHKDFVVACITKTDDNNVTTYQSKRFSTFTKGLRELLTSLTTSETQRTQNCLTSSNIRLANVVSDINGKSAKRILAKILENPSDTSFDIEPLLHKSMLSKVDDIALAIDGVITQEQADKLQIIEQHFDSLNLCKANLEKINTN